MKDTSPQELIEAVRKAARGEVVLHSRVVARVIQELYGVDQDTPDPLTTLSERELDVLRLVAGGLNNVEIAEQLMISDKTVKSHVSNIPVTFLVNSIKPKPEIFNRTDNVRWNLERTLTFAHKRNGHKPSPNSWQINNTHV